MGGFSFALPDATDCLPQPVELSYVARITGARFMPAG